MRQEVRGHDEWQPSKRPSRGGKTPRTRRYVHCHKGETNLVIGLAGMLTNVVFIFLKGTYLRLLLSPSGQTRLRKTSVSARTSQLYELWQE